MGRTVRDTLFLSRFPISALPWMFVLYGVASAITVVVYVGLFVGVVVAQRRWAAGR